MKIAMVTAMAALLALPVAASAQDDGLGVQGRWSVTFAGGASVPLGGQFHEGGRGTVLGLATTVNAQDTQDIFDTGFAWRAGLGYGVSRHVEVFGDFSWKRATASNLSVGNVASLDLQAEFGDYTSYGMEGGVRMHFAPDATIDPYVSALGGFYRVEAIPGTFRVPAANVTLSDTPFFDDSTVPVVGADVGVLFAMNRFLSVGMEGGFRYHSDLTDIEGLAGTGLENLNDAGDRWSLPISGVFRVSF